MSTSPQPAAAPSRDESASGAVSLTGVSKRFGDFVAVKDLDLEVRSGEFLSMLGPSGSGKTTVLRMIAGFEDLSAGKIHLSGKDVTNVAPNRRPVNTVFQDYALFPHLTIAENVGYGLKVAGVARAERERLVAESIEQVKLTAVAKRLPHQLSGGQRQRIALARALILRPQVLLLDEPLGALDKQLREEMQIELKQIQREVGITFIFVTHDQEEALTLSDRVAVFNNGKIEQIGTARDVYEFPTTEFVARFLGLSNIIPADLAGKLTGNATMMSIRPERTKISRLDDTTSGVSIEGVIREAVYSGPTTRYIVDTPDGVRLIAERQNDHHPTAEAPFQREQTVRVSWQPDHAALIPETADAATATDAA